MKAKHHCWSSLAASGALLGGGIERGAAGPMVGAFLIDGGHIIDQIEAKD